MRVARLVFGKQFAEQMANDSVTSNYRGIKTSSMKDGFIHKLNIVVTSLSSVHRDAEDVSKFHDTVFLQLDAIRESMSNLPKLTP